MYTAEDAAKSLEIFRGVHYDEIIEILLNNGATSEHEIHPSIKLAKNMRDKKIIGILSEKTQNQTISTRDVRLQSRKNRTSQRSRSPLKNTSGRNSAMSTLERSIKTPAKEGICVVCQRNKATQMLVPCGHVSCCRGCIKQFIENQEPCPICGLKFYATKTVCED